MDLTLVAVIIGIVEGITEFLPISSTGHMIIVGHLLGFDGSLAKVFDVFIQLGAILSVIFLYRDKFRHFFTPDGWKVDKGLSVWHVAAGIVPVMGIAFFAHSSIKQYLFSPFTVAIGFVLGAFLMMYAEKKTENMQEYLLNDVDKISIRQAALVGAFQILSLWPGFSRSGSTIGGGLLIGLTRKAAAEYSFIIAVPLMFVACIYDLMKNMSSLSTNDLHLLAIGFVVSFVVAYFSIIWFIGFLNRSRLTSFAYYRIIMAVVTLWYFYL
ncbi:MAG: undecaprenyl-diphosphate phosphatase [Acidaminococcaceae bacterium]